MLSIDYSNLDLSDPPEPTLTELVDELDISRNHLLIACERYRALPLKRRGSTVDETNNDSIERLYRVIQNLLYQNNGVSPEDIAASMTTIFDDDNIARVTQFNEITVTDYFIQADYSKAGLKQDLLEIMYTYSVEPEPELMDRLMAMYLIGAEEDLEKFNSIVLDSDIYRRIQIARSLGSKALGLGIVSSFAAGGAFLGARSALK